MNVCLNLLPPNSLGNMFIDITVQWKINVKERWSSCSFDLNTLCNTYCEHQMSLFHAPEAIVCRLKRIKFI